MRALALVLLMALSSTARADDVVPVDRRASLYFVIVGGVVWGGSELGKSLYGPEDCRWCDSNSVDRDVRDALVWDEEDGKYARAMSHASAYVLVPLIGGGLVALGAHRRDRHDQLFDDLLVVAESAILSGLLVQST